MIEASPPVSRSPGGADPAISAKGGRRASDTSVEASLVGHLSKKGCLRCLVYFYFSLLNFICFSVVTDGRFVEKKGK